MIAWKVGPTIAPLACGSAKPPINKSTLSTDVYVVSALRNLLSAPLVGGEVDEIDLIAIDIQRERDVGIVKLVPGPVGMLSFECANPEIMLAHKKDRYRCQFRVLHHPGIARDERTVDTVGVRERLPAIRSH